MGIKLAQFRHHFGIILQSVGWVVSSLTYLAPRDKMRFLIYSEL